MVSMKKLVFPLLLIALLAVVLAGCATPNTAPAAQPTTESASTEPAATTDSIIGSWQWTNFADPKNGPVDIENPENWKIG
jgi:PBP1b-binding outer membrane lipoprotein LpoB